MGAGVDAKCGMSELMVFIAALIAGTGCSLTSKLMLDMKGVGMDGEEEKFQVLLHIQPSSNFSLFCIRRMGIYQRNLFLL